MSQGGMVVRLGGRGMWSSTITVTDCRVADDEHSSDNQCDGLPTDCVTGVFGSSGRGARRSLVLGAR